MNDTNPTVMYAFRFTNSNKLVHLNQHQQQLDSIPYFSTLVARKDNFLSIQNFNGEYILNPPIDYNWFIPVLHSITFDQPYVLLNELLENDNILDTLQLFDYLGISFPLLEEKHVILLTPLNKDNETRKIEYTRASLSEARNMAAEFIYSPYQE